MKDSSKEFPPISVVSILGWIVAGITIGWQGGSKAENWDLHLNGNGSFSIIRFVELDFAWLYAFSKSKNYAFVTSELQSN